MQNLTASRRTILGNVTDGNGRPLTGLMVRAFDRDLRSEQQLGASVTDAQGHYRIDYLAPSFTGAEKKTADVAMKVFGPGDALVFETDFDHIVFNSSDFETIDIVIAAQIKTDVNEFDFLLREIAELTAGIKTLQLQETDEHRDVSFLAREA